MGHIMGMTFHIIVNKYFYTVEFERKKKRGKSYFSLSIPLLETLSNRTQFLTPTIEIGPGGWLAAYLDNDWLLYVALK